jgi:hypothetical protein
MNYPAATQTEITKEVWFVSVHPDAVDPSAHPAVEISVESGAPASLSVDMLIFRGEGTEYNQARAQLVIRAPTFYRLLEQVLALGVVPDDLAHTIQLNLHRATPNKYPAPKVRPRRQSAWEKLLSDDEG